MTFTPSACRFYVPCTFGQHVDPPDKLIQTQAKLPAHTCSNPMPRINMTAGITSGRSTPPMCVSPWSRQLGSWGLHDQRRAAMRRATLTEWLEIRFHGISNSCFLVAATTALRKRDFVFISLPCSFFGVWTPFSSETSMCRAIAAAIRLIRDEFRTNESA